MKKISKFQKWRKKTRLNKVKSTNPCGLTSIRFFCVANKRSFVSFGMGRSVVVLDKTGTSLNLSSESSCNVCKFEDECNGDKSKDIELILLIAVVLPSEEFAPALLAVAFACVVVRFVPVFVLVIVLVFEFVYGTFIFAFCSWHLTY